MRTQRPPSASVRQTPQRARIDANGTGNPRAVAKRVYSREFIARIGNEFGFDPFEGNRVDDLRWFARTYILNRRLESKWDERARLRRSGKSYGEFHEVTQDFLSWLKKSYGHADFYNIATEMLFVARSRREPEPQNNFPKLTEHQRRTEAHYRELLRLTEILAATLARGLRESEPPRGPIPDQPLRHFVSSCAGFWMYDLGRPFTIDYAKKDPELRGPLNS